MDYLIAVIMLTSVVNSAYSVRCIECSQTHFTGDPNFDDCYKLESLSTMEDTNCYMSAPDAYCYTKIELSDGMLSHLERGCANPKEDALYATDEAPDSMKCTTSYGNVKESQSIHQTECYMSCKGDVCNVMKILDQFKSCPRGCPANTECNYLIGKCQCGPGRHGEDCSSNNHAPSSHSCVQCNSQTHPNCFNMTEGTKCQNGERHCSTTQTWILNQNGSTDGKPIVTRSCTSQYVSPDRCYLTDTSDISAAEYTEYTCVSTCSAENCNTGIANGVVDEEFIPMKCVVCDGDDVSCGPSKTFTTDCPRDTTHCYSAATYWETIVKDSKLKGVARPEPSVSIRSIKRGCASGPVKSSCVKKRVGVLNLYEVSCSETCSEDGCNTGWPARPKCVKCDNVADESQGQICLNSPPASQDCQGPHHEYCFTKYDNEEVTATSPGFRGAHKNGKFTIVRGCSRYADTPASSCHNVNEYDRIIGMKCMNYCRDSGCNYQNVEVPPLHDTPKPGNLDSGAMSSTSLSLLNVSAITVLVYVLPLHNR